MSEEIKLNDTYALLGKTIRQKRESQSISVQDLANGLGMSRDRLELIENGKDRDITISEIILFSRKLNISLNKLFVDFH